MRMANQDLEKKSMDLGKKHSRMFDQFGRMRPRKSAFGVTDMRSMRDNFKKKKGSVKREETQMKDRRRSKEIEIMRRNLQRGKSLEQEEQNPELIVIEGDEVVAAEKVTQNVKKRAPRVQRIVKIENAEKVDTKQLENVYNLKKYKAREGSAKVDSQKSRKTFSRPASSRESKGSKGVVKKRKKRVRLEKKKPMIHNRGEQVIDMDDFNDIILDDLESKKSKRSEREQIREKLMLYPKPKPVKYRELIKTSIGNSSIDKIQKMNSTEDVINLEEFQSEVREIDREGEREENKDFFEEKVENQEEEDLVESESENEELPCKPKFENIESENDEIRDESVDENLVSEKEEIPYQIEHENLVSENEQIQFQTEEENHKSEEELSEVEPEEVKNESDQDEETVNEQYVSNFERKKFDLGTLKEEKKSALELNDEEAIEMESIMNRVKNIVQKNLEEEQESQKESTNAQELDKSDTIKDQEIKSEESKGEIESQRYTNPSEESEEESEDEPEHIEALEAEDADDKQNDLNEAVWEYPEDLKNLEYIEHTDDMEKEENAEEQGHENFAIETEDVDDQENEDEGESEQDIESVKEEEIVENLVEEEDQESEDNNEQSEQEEESNQEVFEQSEEENQNDQQFFENLEQEQEDENNEQSLEQLENSENEEESKNTENLENEEISNHQINQMETDQIEQENDANQEEPDQKYSDENSISENEELIEFEMSETKPYEIRPKRELNELLDKIEMSDEYAVTHGFEEENLEHQPQNFFGSVSSKKSENEQKLAQSDSLGNFEVTESEHIEQEEKPYNSSYYEKESLKEQPDASRKSQEIENLLLEEEDIVEEISGEMDLENRSKVIISLNPVESEDDLKQTNELLVDLGRLNVKAKSNVGRSVNTLYQSFEISKNEVSQDKEKEQNKSRGEKSQEETERWKENENDHLKVTLFNDFTYSKDNKDGESEAKQSSRSKRQKFFFREPSPKKKSVKRPQKKEKKNIFFENSSMDNNEIPSKDQPSPNMIKIRKKRFTFKKGKPNKQHKRRITTEIEDISYGSQVILRSRDSDNEKKGFYTQTIEQGMSTSSYRQGLFQKIQNLKREGFSEAGEISHPEEFFQTEKTGRLLNRGGNYNMKSQPEYKNFEKRRRSKPKKRTKSSSVNKSKRKKIKSAKKKAVHMDFKKTGEIDIGSFDLLFEQRQKSDFEAKLDKKRSKSRKKSQKKKKKRKSEKNSELSKASRRSSKSRFSIRSLRKSEKTSTKNSRKSSKKKKRRRSSEVRRKDKKDIEQILENLDKDFQEKSNVFQEMQNIETGQQSSQSLLKTGTEVQLEDFYRRYETGANSQMPKPKETPKNIFQEDSDGVEKDEPQIQTKDDEKEAISRNQFESINTDRTRSRSRVRYQRRLKSDQNLSSGAGDKDNQSVKKKSQKRRRRSQVIRSSLEDKFDNVMDFQDFSRRSMSQKKRRSRMYAESAYSDISGRSRAGSLKVEKNCSVEARNYFSKVDSVDFDALDAEDGKKRKKKIKKKKKKKKKRKASKKKKKKKQIPEFPKDLHIEKEVAAPKKKKAKQRNFFSQRSRSVRCKPLYTPLIYTKKP